MLCKTTLDLGQNCIDGQVWQDIYHCASDDTIAFYSSQSIAAIKDRAQEDGSFFSSATSVTWLFGVVFFVRVA